MESSSDISAEGMKSFVKHLCLLSKRHDEREKAIGSLDSQMKKVKLLTVQTPKPKKWMVERELRELERKMSVALENERKLLGMGARDSELIQKLRDTIFSLEYQLKHSEAMRKSEEEKNREMITDLGNSVADLREKISMLSGREERLKKLEKKIKRLS